MVERFVEYGAVRATDALHQGDILESVDKEASMWKRHLLVITADCDFAHGKHQGRVTCVPLLAASEYLLELHIPRIREKLLRRPLIELKDLAARHAKVQLSEKRLREWVQEEAPESITSAMGVSGDDLTKASGYIRSISLMTASSTTLEEAMENLVSGQMACIPSPKRETAVARVGDPVRQAYSQPPGDALFVGAIGPSLESGYFAYLRHLEQVREPQIATGPSLRDVEYRRVSRLKDRYSHALVQRFAMVFLSIGLPGEYEEIRDLHADLVAGDLK